MPRSLSTRKPLLPQATAPMQPTAAVRYGVLDDLLGYAMRRAQNALYLHFFDASIDPELTPQRFSALVLIDQNPGIDQTALSQAMGINRSGAMRLVDWFETRGFALRVSHETDARRWGVSLTASGKKTMAAMSKAIRAHDERLVSLLGDEGPRLKQLLERLAAVANADLKAAKESRSASSE